MRSNEFPYCPGKLKVSAHKSEFLYAQLWKQYVLPGRLFCPGYGGIDANKGDELNLSAGVFCPGLLGPYVPGTFVSMGEGSSTQ